MLASARTFRGGLIMAASKSVHNFGGGILDLKLWRTGLWRVLGGGSRREERGFVGKATWGAVIAVLNV